MKLFVPICGHKEHQFTGLTSTIGNGEEFRGWWGMHQESISVGGCWSKGSSSSSIWGCVCQLQTPEQNGELCFGGEGNPSSDQLSPVSHPSLRSIATCFWLFPSVSTSQAASQSVNGSCPQGICNLPILWVQKVPGAAVVPTFVCGS